MRKLSKSVSHKVSGLPVECTHEGYGATIQPWSGTVQIYGVAGIEDEDAPSGFTVCPGSEQVVQANAEETDAIVKELEPILIRWHDKIAKRIEAERGETFEAEATESAPAKTSATKALRGKATSKRARR